MFLFSQVDRLFIGGSKTNVKTILLHGHNANNIKNQGYIDWSQTSIILKFENLTRKHENIQEWAIFSLN